MATAFGAPRLISPHEIAVVQRLMQVGMDRPPSPWELESVGFLTVEHECECGCDAVFFKPQSLMGQPIASGYGFIHWGCPVELVLWAYEGAMSFLELEPKAGGLARLPVAESIRALPDDFYNVSWECRARRKPAGRWGVRK
jgi:hypothetical protein